MATSTGMSTTGTLAYDDAAQRTVRPLGGHSDPALHNRGNNQSEFTSWTTDESIARDAVDEANGPGIVLRIPNADGPEHERVPSPDIYGESGVLIRGPVFGARQQYAIQFSHEAALNSGLRPVKVKDNIFTIPGGSCIAGACTVTRVR